MADEPDEPLAPVLDIRAGVRRPEGLPPTDESPVEPLSYPGGACRHQSLTVDPKKRTVECKRCGAVVDPFDALLTVAADWDGYAMWVRAAKRDRELLLKEVDELKRQRRNLRAQVRRADKRG
jgi:hypothetical protein